MWMPWWRTRRSQKPGLSGVWTFLWVFGRLGIQALWIDDIQNESPFPWTPSVFSFWWIWAPKGLKAKKSCSVLSFKDLIWQSSQISFFCSSIFVFSLSKGNLLFWGSNVAGFPKHRHYGTPWTGSPLAAQGGGHTRSAAHCARKARKCLVSWWYCWWKKSS